MSSSCLRVTNIIIYTNHNAFSINIPISRTRFMSNKYTYLSYNDRRKDFSKSYLGFYSKLSNPHLLFRIYHTTYDFPSSIYHTFKI